MMIHHSASSASRRFLGLGLAAACGLASALTAHAQVFSGLGDASIQNPGSAASTGVTPPTTATAQYLITTESAAAGHDGATVSGVSAVPVTQLASFLDLGPAQVAYNSNNPGTEGSGEELTLAVTAKNNAISFAYDFVTSERVGLNNVNPDFAFYSLTPVDSNGVPTGAATFGRLASAADAAGGFAVINDPTGRSPFNLQEGYKTFTTGAIATPGNYLLGIGVADANTFDTQSGLFISNVQLVPEPSTWALLGMGASVGAGVWLRRRTAAV